MTRSKRNIKSQEEFHDLTREEKYFLMDVIDELDNDQKLSRERLEEILRERKIPAGQRNDITELALVKEARHLINLPVSISEKYEKLIKLSKVQSLLKKSQKEQKGLGGFSTPIPIANLMGMWIQYSKPGRIFNPAAGVGMLICNFSWPSSVTVSESDANKRRMLFSQGLEKILNLDLSKPVIEYSRYFDAIILNSPSGKTNKTFERDQYKFKDLDHITAINSLDTLKNSGRAAILISDNDAKRVGSITQGRNAQFFEYLTQQYNVQELIPFDAARAKLEGTPSMLYLILINGRRKKPDRELQVKSQPLVHDLGKLWDVVLSALIHDPGPVNGYNGLNGSIARTSICYLDLFSGLGAFAKGLHDGGFELKHHYYSEIDKHAIANYRYNFKHAKHVGRIEEVKSQKIPRPNIITFGSPCQNLSIAGKGEGITGDRSRLFFDAVKIIDWFKPDFFVFENVKGLLSSNEGEDFEIVLREIAKLGVYDCQWQLINSTWFLPQNRERLFLVGSLTKLRSPQIFPITTGYEENPTGGQRIKIEGNLFSRGQAGRIFKPDGFSPTLMSSHGYNNGFVKTRQGIRRLTSIECERLQGLPDDWTKYGNYDGEVREISETQRYALLGNAVTSKVIKVIAKKMRSEGLNGISGETEIENKSRSLIEGLNNLNYD